MRKSQHTTCCGYNTAMRYKKLTNASGQYLLLLMFAGLVWRKRPLLVAAYKRFSNQSSVFWQTGRYSRIKNFKEERKYKSLSLLINCTTLNSREEQLLLYYFETLHIYKKCRFETFLSRLAMILPKNFRQKIKIEAMCQCYTVNVVDSFGLTSLNTKTSYKPKK